MFFEVKSWIRRDGTPAVILQWWWTSFWRSVGRAEVLGRMSKKSQCVFWARSCEVESLEGSIIQRITRDMMRGDRVVDLSVDRKVNRGLGVVGCNEIRWRLQSGILAKNRA